MRLLKNQNTYAFPYILAIIFAMILGMALSASAYLKYDEIQKATTLRQVSIAAAALDQSRILNLTGTERDLTSPDYIYLKDKLAKIKAVNADIHFAYLAGYRDGQPFFFADSEPDNSPDSSPPGEIYTEAEPSFSMPFFTKKPLIERVYPDRWGLWLTVLSPIFDPTSPDKVIAELGIDVDARNRTLELLINSSPAIFFAIFVAALIMLALILKRKDDDLQHLREDFTSMMVHELRSPLTGIKSLTETILEIPAQRQGDDYAQNIRLIQKSSSGMLELVSDLLDAAKLASGKFEIHKEPASIKNLLSDRLNFFTSSLKEARIKVETFFDPNLPEAIEFDPQRIGQVLNNLFSNAIKFTPEGGKITIQAFFHKKSRNINDEIRLIGGHWLIRKDDKKLADLPDALIIAITDNGIGISSKNLNDVFNKFKQFEFGALRSGKRGTGLGLSIAKGLVEAHSGKIGVASEEGVGSTFYFSLPVLVGEA